MSTRLRLGEAGSQLRTRLRWEHAVWGLPLVAFVLVRRFPAHLPTAIEAIIAVGVVFLAFRFPGRSLILLVALLPLQQLVLAAAYRYGMPAALVRGVGAWKEALAIGILLAGLRAVQKGTSRFDSLDGLAFAYLLLALLYLLAPGLMANGPKRDFYVRLLAYRADAMFVVLFIGARHAPIARRYRDRLVRAAVITGIIAGAIGVFEFLASDTWNNFIVKTLQYNRFTTDIFGAGLINPVDIRVYGNVGSVQFVRIGSIFLNPLPMAFYLVLVLGLGLELVARNEAKPWVYAGLLTIGATLIFTITRSAILAGAVAAVFTLVPGPGRPVAHRARLSLALVAVLILAIPLAAAANLTTRSQGAVQGTDTSTQQHSSRLGSAIADLGRYPLGQGLATGPSVDVSRFNNIQETYAENAYIQIGNEMGIVTMVVFIALLITLLRRLRAPGGPTPHDTLRGGVWQAGIALAIGGLLLHVWIYLHVAWIWWGAAGLALNAYSASDAEQTEDAQVSVI